MVNPIPVNLTAVAQSSSGRQLTDPNPHSRVLVF